MRNIFCKTCTRARTVALYVGVAVLTAVGVDSATSSLLSRALASLLGVPL